MRVDNAPFTQREDEELMRLYQSFGNSWSKIARKLRNRSDLQVRYRIGTLTGRKQV